MPRPRTADPGIRLGPDERDALVTLAPLRTTLERHVLTRTRQLLGREPTQPELKAEVELLWTIVLEAFHRGVRGIHRGLHRAEGVDHEMLDESLAFALEAGLKSAPPPPKRKP